MSKKIRVYLAFAAILGMCPILMAQEAKPTPAPVKRKPIHMRMETAKGIHYFYEGAKVDGLENLDKIISPLHDTEADRLVALSKSSNSSGVAFIIGGGVFFAGGLVVAATDPNFSKQNAVLDTQEGIGLGTLLVGVVGLYVGIFKVTDARSAEFNAVQRYNDVVGGGNETSWNDHRTLIKMDLLALKF
jgi:hypothetical protein